MVKILVTGATGQIGSHLVELLLESKPFNLSDPREIICLVRTPEKAAFLKSLNVSLIQGDLRDQSILHQIFTNHDIKIVFHLAANVFVYAKFDEIYQDNVIGTQYLLHEFINSNAITFVFTSSIVVYDHSNVNGKKSLITEEWKIGSLTINEDTPYAISKRLTEKFIQKLQKSYPEKNFIIARIGPVSGKRDRQMIPALVQAFGLPVPKLVNHGKGQLCLSSPKDCARAEIFLAKNVLQTRGNAYNIADTMISFREIFNIIADYYNKEPPKISIPFWLFKIFLPLLKLIKRIIPKNDFIQTLLSSSTLEYLEHTYHYDSIKLRKMGFKFKEDIHDTLYEGLANFDPDKTFLKK